MIKLGLYYYMLYQNINMQVYCVMWAFDERPTHGQNEQRSNFKEDFYGLFLFVWLVVSHFLFL